MIESLYKEITTTTLYSDVNRTKAVQVNIYKPDVSDYAAVIDFITAGLKSIAVTKKDLQTLSKSDISRKCLEKLDQVMNSNNNNNNEEYIDLLTNLFVFNEKGIDCLKNIVKNVFFELDVNKLTFNVLVNCMFIILQEGSTALN